MDSSHLTEQQAAALRDKLQPMLGYLRRLAARMQEQGWPPNDPVRKGVDEAAETLFFTYNKLSRLAVPAGTGWKSASAASATPPAPPATPQHHTGVVGRPARR